jgi:hypothetical protein
MVSRENETININRKIFSQIFVSLRILLIIPTTVASAERSFSKLKLVKNYLRSAMSHTIA